MGVHEARVVTARKGATAVARPQRSLERRRNRAPLAADIERRAAVVFRDGDEAAVARETSERLDREIRTPPPSAEG
jgi:hypothetical protein